MLAVTALAAVAALWAAELAFAIAVTSRPSGTAVEAFQPGDAAERSRAVGEFLARYSQQ